MTSAELYRVVLDTIADFPYGDINLDEELAIDEDGQYTVFALSLAQAIADTLDGDF